MSASLLDKTMEYIKNQREHHRKMTFQEEFLALLKSTASPTTRAISGSKDQPSLGDSCRVSAYPNAGSVGLLSECPSGTGLRAFIGLDTIHVASGSALAETIAAR